MAGSFNTWAPVSAASADSRQFLSYSMESLKIVTVNTIPPLLYSPSGDLTTLIVAGLTFTSVHRMDEIVPDFIVSGNILIWNGPPTINPGDKVVAIYTYIKSA